MTIQLFDTASREARDFVPADQANVLMYVCGPTVYDDPHLGHARASVVFDVLYRVLRRQYGIDGVTYLRNYTDVDDKIIVRANERQVAIDDITERYIDSYEVAMAALGCLDPDLKPRVTQVMDEIIAYVQKLVDSEIAYAVDGDVFFSIDAFPAYGKLSQRGADELQTVHRVEVDPRKRNPLDFAVWKSAKPDEPSWDSPWGPGRPGWHIECSVMATHFGRNTLDIHGGGQDLIFPHHENEIAQCESLTGVPFANYWVHNGFVRIDAEKMSKSLGNFTTVSELLDVWPAECLRYFLLSAQYRTPLDFTLQAVAEAVKALARIYDGFAWLDIKESSEIEPTAKQRGRLDRLAVNVRAARKGLWTELQNDMNTPAALSNVFDAVREMNQVIRGFPEGVPSAASDARAAAAELLSDLRELLGICQGTAAEFNATWNRAAAAILGIDTADIDARVQSREDARLAKDWDEADRIRDELAGQGVVLEDAGTDSSWRIDPLAAADTLRG